MAVLDNVEENVNEVVPEKIDAMNRQTLKDRIASYKRTPGSFIVMLLVLLAAAITIIALVYLLVYILVNGVPYLNADLFSWTYTSENVSVVPAIINTVIMALISLLFAIPFGIGSAIYLVEYAKKGNKLVKVVRVTAETLTGILFFVTALHWRFSILAGACTLAIMVLPVILRTTEEALMAVPDSFREGSFGLGAGKLRTIFKIILPSAVPGILSGVILSVGRIVGETAALMYTAGTVAAIPKNLFSSGRTLAVHMYVLASEGLHVDQAYATAVVLLILVILINALSSFLAKKIQKV